ncbi:Fibrinogen-like protein A,Ryncolin-4,Angiopoietin-related protein 1,Ficolin-3,Ficolin-2,Fibrinogen-like protein 1-like protein,Ryncolin-1,Tenascin-R,Fibrinogen-like protein 1,Fibrinogen C domain-containing protein 1-A,Tenascin-N,Ryncolin-3,Fibroleukin,Fibrinogen C domain-containing protein 1,Ryncolin-2,Angiopoietin-related protein 6,Angiopoietin-related protein 2,Microfibril-associated glycoprotein 4,Fibrinogen alpha chain,Ficolin-1,Fibrinogen C domain-containing protein 1-B,Angiopoietin-4 [Mytilus coruscu|uniref:Fibrinogen C-terminal domain-containing protein n=1 Tax=Mytilus coruscus TaxID=42192 RepID=A0A6J8A8I9_MYTCO|nr:Fibrinogen-like protein A,Ryncolin-4,Angiopoietin-related protein 1,Ficolin-3,Ficolin-2,Fibrinogen-like protein 1-like protein,Ryncolin-1,Tenascin-R,Fibrinogen-like protein 1,Fibrinogen C domain-containing protein 1-A,Tenascin-N,Ryncolin-3,Fibroleukin,Fibrinogen C domain-containing protein 1,Ryncolin-2,Angiopoietin-related protein 6,Angiopoietin-related protein 2,Microfibril-associated glycoprotein 4,Fibrinogen alpha chain,Ficolin-1,Fibrinogen C domain-containing protein 1-B,Angiopoietin-4 [Myti
MKCYWNLNTLLVLVVCCLLLHGYTHGYVTAVDSDTVKTGSEDPLSIPLISDKGAPLVAMLDTITINRKIKSYIKTILKNMIQNTLQGHVLEFVKTSLEENSTIDLIRNITLQELNGVLKDQIQGTPKDCTELKTVRATSGVYQIFPEKTEGVKAYCDMDTESGGWTIIQKRYDDSVNFQRMWTEYENGFGNVNGEYWLGNKYIHRLTSSGTYELRIELTDKKKNNKKYAMYTIYVVGDTASQYKLTIGGYSGNAEDSLIYSNGMKFTTVDRDNDLFPTNCAKDRGPWWFKSCSHSALNNPSRDKWYWYYISGHYVKTSVMMIRKV